MAAGVVLCVTLAGCASSSALKQARTAEQAQDYDAAVVAYTKALRDKTLELRRAAKSKSE